MLAISRVGSDRIGSDRIGSGRVGSGGIQISQVRLGHRRPTRPAKSGLTSEAKPLVLFLRERDRHLFVPQMSTIELFFLFFVLHETEAAQTVFSFTAGSEQLSRATLHLLTEKKNVPRTFWVHLVAVFHKKNNAASYCKKRNPARWLSTPQTNRGFTRASNPEPHCKTKTLQEVIPTPSSSLGL